MFKLAILAVLVAVAAASSDDVNWLIFKKSYNKAYSGREDVVRRYIWQSNMRKVQEHNILYAQGKSSYYMGENQFADMTVSEFAAQMNGLRMNVTPGVFAESAHNSVYLPDTVDWRTKGYVTPIKNQGQCGSCWAFSTTGSVEGQHFKASGKLVSLSESNLVDCSGSYGNEGCNGGFMDSAFKYIIAKGIDTEASYPYKPEDRKCAYKKANVGATISSFKDVTKGSEAALQQASATIGPISVAIDASHASFQMYKGGIYDEPSCSSTQLDHGVLAIGYGTEGGKDYWLVKNSWGTTWGNKGYIQMSRNKQNQCGIATMASYPIV